MRVLVVEDEKKTASFVRKALQAEGFAVDACHDGNEALTAASSAPFDAIVLDIMLPGRDGLSVLRQLRERRNATPVLLLSARGEVNERVEELTVTGDRHRLRQLLLNLTDNAIKYNQPQGEVTLSLRRTADFAELAISNTGNGIAPEHLPRVFDPFFRGDPSHSNQVPGCGLGLSIARWIATAHGGEIQISSRPGEVTTATVRFPLRVSS